jgi:transposase, IS30 family
VTLAERTQIRRLVGAGCSFGEVVEASGRSWETIRRIVIAAGGVPPRGGVRAELRLSLAEREEISLGVAAGESARAIAARLGRAPSTISREVSANGGRSAYRAWAAEHAALRRARRPKVAKLARCGRLRREVEAGLQQRWSPEQIARRLREDFPDQVEMRVSHETIYQSLFVQGRGALRKELATFLRSGRATRRARGRGDGRGQLRDMVMIAERPAEAEDRAVPGHWEGDLIIGKNGRSAIATLVERSTRFVMLVHLPDNHGAAALLAAMTEQALTLPAQLRRSLTWDQGKEMAEHVAFTLATDLAVYFCDPHSPWQRGSNENTNGLLRQYFPKGTDLSVHSRADLDFVANELNGRPRETLQWKKPCERFAELVAMTA